MIRGILIAFLAVCAFTVASSQDDTGYQLPPKEIVAIVDAPQTPGVLVSPDNKTILLLDRPGLVSIAELSKPELRLAGLRLDPLTNGLSRSQYVIRISSMNIDGTGLRELSGIPSDPKIGNIAWSDDSRLFIFTNTIHTITTSTRNPIYFSRTFFTRTLSRTSLLTFF